MIAHTTNPESPFGPLRLISRKNLSYIQSGQRCWSGNYSSDGSDRGHLNSMSNCGFLNSIVIAQQQIGPMTGYCEGLGVMSFVYCDRVGDVFCPLSV